MSRSRVLLCAGRDGAFQRACRMATIVDQTEVHAASTNGVLALRLPTHAAATPQGMPIIG
ncbi:MAG: Hsp20/alpha crystallin family protein [Candidatus Tectomicrobia bacterium]|nr:Hsp20/alpha crystallin family protein [Candidatus Tectomicrobia bacterium]